MSLLYDGRALLKTTLYNTHGVVNFINALKQKNLNSVFKKYTTLFEFDKNKKQMWIKMIWKNIHLL